MVVPVRFADTAAHMREWFVHEAPMWSLIGVIPSAEGGVLIHAAPLVRGPSAPSGRGRDDQIIGSTFLHVDGTPDIGVCRGGDSLARSGGTGIPTQKPCHW